jgi:hypothetical protein
MKPTGQAWIAFDQWVNAKFFGGWADETISARAYRNAAQGIPKWVRIRRAIDGLFFWEADHCHQSFLSEVNRLHVPPAYRSTYLEAENDA